jgi:hypothetical protein
MNSPITRLIDYGESTFDALEAFWENPRTQRFSANLLIVTFILTLIIIELRRRGFLPDALKSVFPDSHFFAVSIAFTMLLGIEILGLVFSVARSVSESLGKQFEILSLILLRQSFKEFIYFDEPIEWQKVSEPVMHILSDTGGALAIFAMLAFYNRIQLHRPVVMDANERLKFIAAKKLVGLLLLLIFISVGLNDLARSFAGLPTYDFFATFYTILVFSDVLLVLVSLRYSPNYLILFRNSGFAVATVIIRLALTAPAYINVLLGVAAAFFAVGVTIAYNVSSSFKARTSKEDL